MAPTRSSSRAAAADSAKKAERKNDKSTKLKVEEDVQLETEAATSGISEYERARLENIRRNEQFLSGLGVAVVKSALTPASKAKPVKKVSVSKGLKAPLLPTRRSSRVTVDKLATEVAQLQKEGKEEEASQRQVELDVMLAKQKEGSYEVDVAPSAAYEIYERIASESISLLTMRGEEESEESVKLSLLSALKTSYLAANQSFGSPPSTICSPAPKSGKSSSRSKALAPAPVSSSTQYLESTADAFAQLSLSANDVMKLTPQRITAVALHPSSSRILAAAGDKNGYMSIWDADFAGRDEENNGVYTYRPHISNIAKLDFSAAHDHRLYSTSYDGTVRFVELTRDSLVRAFEAPETLRDMYLTDSCFLPNQPDSLLLAKSDGYLALADLRSGNNHYVFDGQVHDSKVSSVQIHPLQEHLVISASNRNGIAFHDLRRLQSSNNNNTIAPLQVLTDHEKAINGAYVSPDGQYLVSVSLDNTVRTWRLQSSSGGLMTADAEEGPHVLAHDNHTGRWLSTFRPAFDPKRAHTLLLGSMLQPRRLEVYTVNTFGNSSGGSQKKKKTTSERESFALELTCNLQEAELLVSVNSRNCFHAHREVVLGSNSSGKVFLFR